MTFFDEYLYSFSSFFIIVLKYNWTILKSPIFSQDTIVDLC